MGKIVRIMWVPVILSLLYTGWVFWTRHTAKMALEGRYESGADPMAAYGSDVKILQFYTDRREIAAHEKSLVCYSVINATAVRLDPPVEKVWPAVSRCFEVTPARSTRYTLTAEGPGHGPISASFEIAVK